MEGAGWSHSSCGGHRRQWEEDVGTRRGHRFTGHLKGDGEVLTTSPFAFRKRVSAAQGHGA